MITRYLKKFFGKKEENRTLEMTDTKDNKSEPSPVKAVPEEPAVVPLPNQQEFFVNSSLYKAYDSLDLTNPAHVLHIRKFEGDPYQLDLHCVECEQDSVFRSNERMFGWGNDRVWGTQGTRSELSKQQYVAEYFDSITGDRVFQIEFLCSRNREHIAAFIFKIHKKKLIKIGQFPSIADTQLPKIQKYRKILKDKYKELAKAVGLFANGVGIGSFIYLRRIIEDLIEQAHSQASVEMGWDEATYQQGRVGEKMGMLKNYLPSFLFGNRTLYGILSKGVHELTEEECLKLFPLVLGAVELILDEKIEALEKKRKIEEISKALNTTSAEMKK